jgi:hypothetical protein
MTLTPEAQAHFARIKTNPVEGDMNYLQWVRYENDVRVIGKIEIPAGFTEPMYFLKGKWSTIKKGENK